MELVQLGTLPAWVALALSAFSIFYTWRVSRKQDEVRWTFTASEAGGYELRNEGRDTAYGMTYKVPMEIFDEGHQVDYNSEGIPVRQPEDMPGGSAISIATFKVPGRSDRYIHVWWYRSPTRKGKRYEWSTELPNHPGHQVKPR